MKVPPKAKRVFKGIIFDVYQWQQKMFDGSQKTFEIIKKNYTAEVIAIKDGKIVLSHQSQPTKKDFYAIFGGRINEGEEPLAAAKRELLEESGMTSDTWELYKIYQPVYKLDWDVYIYIAKNCKKTADLKLDSGEKSETKTCSFAEFVDIVLSDKYWGDELVLDVLRMKDKGTLNNFKSKLLG
jgi:ADP-ribose pyrophosphatase